MKDAALIALATAAAERKARGIIPERGPAGRAGKDGKDGADGAGIRSVTASEGRIHILLDDGRTFDHSLPPGPVGPKGPAGPAGSRGDAGEDGATWFLTEDEPARKLGEDDDLALAHDGAIYRKEDGNWVYQFTLGGSGGGMSMMPPALRPSPYRNVVYTDVDRTAQYGDMVVVTATSTQTLPAAQNHIGELITIKRLDPLALPTIQPSPGETIDDDADGRIFNIDTWSEDYISDGQGNWLVR